jgi:uncharacterized damage-inducible protein DinB
MVTKDDLLQEMEQEAHATRRALERVPQDRLGWKPHPKSLTLGQLAMHVATIPGALAQVATTTPFDVRAPIPRPQPANVAELVPALDQSLAKARELLGGLDEASMASAWRGVEGGREVMVMPRSAFLRAILLNHWYHHRGQLTVYLRQVGVPVPAIYGASADENPFAG